MDFARYMLAALVGAAVVLLGLSLYKRRRQSVIGEPPPRHDAGGSQKTKGFHKRYEAIEGRVRHLETEIKGKVSAEKFYAVTKKLFDEIAAIENNMRAMAQRQEQTSGDILQSDKRSPRATGNLTAPGKLSEDGPEPATVVLSKHALQGTQAAEQFVWDSPEQETPRPAETQAQLERPSVAVPWPAQPPENTAKIATATLGLSLLIKTRRYALGMRPESRESRVEGWGRHPRIPIRIGRQAPSIPRSHRQTSRKPCVIPRGARDRFARENHTRTS